MCFKARFLALFVAAFFTSACWYPGKNLTVGEKNPPSGKVSVDLSKFSCLRNIDKNVDNYLKGRSSTTEVRNFMDCVRTALVRFRSSIKDRSSVNYSPDSLRRFLNTEYLPERKITSGLATEIMALKIVILGGNDQVITSSEMDRLMALVDTFERQAIENLPYISLYRLLPGLEKEKLDRMFIDRARWQMRQTGLEWADILRSNNKAYALASLERFLKEIRMFLNWEKLHPNAYAVGDVLNLVRAYKEIATGSRAEVVRAQDWPMLFDSTTSLYGLYINYKVKLEGQSLMYGQGLEFLISTVNEGFSLVERLIDQQPEKMIGFTATDSLFSALAQIQALPWDVREQSVRDVYRYLVAKGFRNPIGAGQHNVVRGLSSRQLTEMRAEFTLWADGQRYLSDNAKRALGVSFSANEKVSRALSQMIQSFDFSKFILNGVDAQDPRSHEIEQIVKNMRPLFRDGDERVFVLPANEATRYGVQHGMFNLSRMNLMRGMVRLLIRAFASDDRIINMSGVTATEMEEFYKKIRPLGEDLKFMDPRKEEVGLRIFNEGNLFTFSGDGVNPKAEGQARLLGFYETMELMSLMWSGGQLRDRIYTDIREKCRQSGVADGPMDVFGAPKINRQCFFKHFYDQKLREFSNLPHLVKYISRRNSDQLADFSENLKEIASIPCEDPQYIEQSEIATIATVLHYSEVIFTVYDRDSNGILNATEAMRAFRRFHGYLSQQVEAMEGEVYDVSMLKAVFAFLIKYQELPTLKDGAVLWWFKWRYFNDDPDEFRLLNRMPVGLPAELAAEERKSLNVKEKKLPDMSIDRMGIIRVLRALSEASPPKMRNPKCRID